MNDQIKLEALSVAMQELEQAYERKANASADYSTLVQATAAASGLEPSVIRSYVASRMADRGAKDQRKTEQLQLCFDQLGA